MSLKAAFDRLATWTPTGITNLGLDDFLGAIPEEQLPALYCRMAGTGGESMRALGIAGSEGRFVVHVNHHLVVCGLGQGLNVERYYGTLTHIDNYMAVLVDDYFLNQNLMEPLAIADTWVGVHDIGNVLYWAVTFRHRWVLRVT